MFFLIRIIDSDLTGGPLMDDVYKLEQYHCHWGCSDSRGSEHTVDGQAFSGEVSYIRYVLELEERRHRHHRSHKSSKAQG